MSDGVKSTNRSILVASLVGGWVGDAASLGLHWLYSSERILEVGGQAPEFLAPNRAHYEGVFGYFAHDGKSVGDVSHYGAATGVLTESLLANHGKLDIRDYQRRFRLFFGPGGAWRGFIDNPTRITLGNLNRIEEQAINEALNTAPVSLSDKQKRILVQKVLPYTRHLSGDQLPPPVREAINLTYKETALQDAGVHIAQTIDAQLTPESGADDTQLPAVTKLAPLVACYSGHPELMERAESAVRVTNHSDDAVAWARCATVLLEALFHGQPMAQALELALKAAPQPRSLASAQSMDRLDGPAAGDAHGRTCYLNEAMPVIFHILSHANSYQEAIRANIQCGGDSCGRAWLIGPAMAAVHGLGGERGIPVSWLAHVTNAGYHYSIFEQLVS